MTYTIVGVIGHIDHGKTSLVAALTGTDTDTHPEEKRRGITIDLGFASFIEGEHQFALVDAPGHQKYIGNLLAGVSAVDVGLLVVACDQGIQAQTLEHAAILQSLGVSKLIVAISRVDLADRSMRDELSEELDLFLADFGFHQVPQVCLSSVTGEGLGELKELLVACARTDGRVSGESFRMPIDRVFTIEGRGCVVAGTLWSGQVAVGDHIHLVRTDRPLRVRELEVHGKPVDQSSVGLRTAMNLVGTSAMDVSRGDELVTAETHSPSRRMVVEVTLFRDAAELRCPATVQMHTAAAACEATIRGVKRIGGGQSEIVIVDTERPVVVTFRQQCLFRKPYPVGSFAGGRVLASVEPGVRQTRRLLQLGQRISQGDAVERLAAWVEFHGELRIDPIWCELQLGISPTDIDQAVKDCLSRGDVQMPEEGLLISTVTIERAENYVLKLLTFQAEATEDAWIDQQSIQRRAATAASPQVVAFVVDRLVEQNRLVRVRNMIAVASEETVLSKKQKARMEKLLTMYSDSRQPPTLKEAAEELGITIDAVTSLVRFATQQRILIELGKGFFISDATYCELCKELKGLFDQSPQQSVSSIREHWQITRKHAIPLLEHCDQIGVTRREGDQRIAGPMLDRYAEQESSEGQPSE